MKIKSKFSGKEYSEGDIFDESSIDNTTNIHIKADLTKDMIETLISMGYVEVVESEEEENREKGKKVLERTLAYLAKYYGTDIKTVVKYLRATEKILPAQLELILALSIACDLRAARTSNILYALIAEKESKCGIDFANGVIIPFKTEADRKMLAHGSVVGTDSIEDAKIVIEALKVWGGKLTTAIETWKILESED